MIKHLSKISEKKVWTLGAMLPFALPVLLLFAFLARQLSGFDSVGWSSGFSHPLEGWDHLVTMLAVGIWAAQMRGKSIWILPLAFVSVMSLGGLAGAAGLSIPSVEGIILLSCAVFSVLITRKIRFSTQVNVLIVGFFAFFHGFAHGQEISTSASLVSYTLGFMLATLLLHGAGILVAKLIVLCVASFFVILTTHTSQAKGVANQHSYAKSTYVNYAETFSDVYLLLAKHDAECFISPQNIDQIEVQGIGLKELSSSQHAYAEISAASAVDDVSLINFKTGNSTYVLAQSNTKFPISTALFLQKLNSLFDNFRVLVRFNAYYPDINNSPGTRLLSNGVGLTSPPLLINAVNVLSNLNSTAPQNTLIEASPLQLPVSQHSLTYPIPTFFNKLAICMLEYQSLSKLEQTVALSAYTQKSNYTKLSYISVNTDKPQILFFQASSPDQLTRTTIGMAFDSTVQNKLSAENPIFALVKPPPIFKPDFCT